MLRVKNDAACMRREYFLWIAQMAFAFEKLLVYQKAMNFSDQICEITLTFPRGFYFLVDQLNRAALSIAANIAEGNGRFTIRDRKNFFGIARGSVQECVPLMELAKRRGLIQSADHLKMKADLEEIAKMLSGLINALDKRQS
jgi:four helix bundle protein